MYVKIGGINYGFKRAQNYPSPAKFTYIKGLRDKKFFAFTLAEVLITLGIIGVVAAMTMPVLTASSRKSEYSARLKKYYSSMQQAVLLYNQDHNMLPEDCPIPDDGYDSLKSFWDTRFAPYFSNVISIEKDNEDDPLIRLADGTSLKIRKGAVVDIIYDVNGDKAPNQDGKDRYWFLLNKGTFSAYGWTEDIGTVHVPDEDEEPYTKDMNDRDNVLRLCKKSGSFCSQLLLLDGWEFKNDYPNKIQKYIK